MIVQGFAFCEYLDGSVTEMAIQGLNGFALGDRNLVVQRAAVGRNTGSGPTAMPGSAGYLHQAGEYLVLVQGIFNADVQLVSAPNILQSANDAGAPTSRCMLLLNMVTPEELISDDDYNDILEDINEECGKYGSVEGVRIPRPTPKSKKWEPTDSAAATAEKNRKADEDAGVGRVYVLYKDLDGVQKAMRAIGGRQFAGRTILVANVSEVRLPSSLSPFRHDHSQFRVLMISFHCIVGRVPRPRSTAASSRGSRGYRRRSCRCPQGYHGGSGVNYTWCMCMQSILCTVIW